MSGKIGRVVAEIWTLHLFLSCSFASFVKHLTMVLNCMSTESWQEVFRHLKLLAPNISASDGTTREPMHLGTFAVLKAILASEQAV